MDTQVMILDDAYSLANELNIVINNTNKKVGEDLAMIINSVKNHWHGYDATVYVNTLIDEYDGYAEYFKELNSMTNYLSSYFVLLQTSRARMSDNQRIGDNAQTTFEFKVIPKIEATKEYYFSPELRKDYDDLCELYDYYSKFADEIDIKASLILENWKNGKGREEVKKYFDSFVIVSKLIGNRISDLKFQLRKVIANEDKVS